MQIKRLNNFGTFNHKKCWIHNCDLFARPIFSRASKDLFIKNRSKHRSYTRNLDSFYNLLDSIRIWSVIRKQNWSIKNYKLIISLFNIKLSKNLTDFCYTLILTSDQILWKWWTIETFWKYTSVHLGKKVFPKQIK